MPVVTISDGNGDTLTQLQIQGCKVSFPTFNFESEDTILSVSKMKVKPADVYICAFPKTGTHMLHEIVTMLRLKTTQDGGMKGLNMLECAPGGYKAIEQLEDPRILNTHLGLDILNPMMFTCGAKIIHITRNIKDIFVSYYHHHCSFAFYEYKGTWEGFFELMFNGKSEYGYYVEYLINWWQQHKDNPNVLWLRYEDVVKNSRGNIEKIAKFLGWESSPQLYDSIAHFCSFQVMKTRKDVIMSSVMNQGDKNKFSIYREGKTGGWRTKFTVEQNERLNKFWKERTANYPDLPIYYEEY